MGDKKNGTGGVEARLEALIRNGKSPSVQYIFFDAGKVIYEYRNGYADIEKQLRVDGNSSFNACGGVRR